MKKQKTTGREKAQKAQNLSKNYFAPIAVFCGGFNLCSSVFFCGL